MFSVPRWWNGFIYHNYRHSRTSFIYIFPVACCKDLLGHVVLKRLNDQKLDFFGAICAINARFFLVKSLVIKVLIN
jgi:hypothetical protein